MAVTFLTNEDKSLIDKDIASLSKEIENLKNPTAPNVVPLEFVQGVWKYVSGVVSLDTTNKNRISTDDGEFVQVEKDATLTPNAGYKVLLVTYALNGSGASIGTWNTEPVTLIPTQKYRLVVGKDGDKAILPEEGKYAVTLAYEVETEDAREGYATIYEEEEDSLAQKVLRDRDANTITMAVITDTHYGGDYAARKTLPQVKAINELALRLGAKSVVHLGDAIHGGHSTLDENKQYLAEFWHVQNDTPMPVLYTLAHHEMYGSGGASNFGNDETAISMTESLGMYGRTNRHLPVVYSSDKANWYVDIDEVRFIGLSCVTETSPAAFSDEAIAFLNTALNGNNPVVVFCHMPCRATVSYNNAGVSKGSTVESALNAYEGGVLAYIHGHTHWDNIFKPDTGTFPFWSVCCAMISKIDIDTYGCSEGNPVSYDRVAGEYSEYCFDIVNIHPDTGIIRSFRFGAGADREYVPAE